MPTCLLFCAVRITEFGWKSSFPNWICMSQSSCHVLMHADAKSLWRTFLKTFLLLELPGGGLSARSSWSYGHCIGRPSRSSWDARLKIQFFNVLSLLLSEEVCRFKSYSLLGASRRDVQKNQELCELLLNSKDVTKNANSENFRRIKNLSISKTFWIWCEYLW